MTKVNHAHQPRHKQVQYYIWQEQAYESMSRADRNMKRNERLANKHEGTELEPKYRTLAFKWYHKIKALESLIEFLSERSL